MRRLSLIGTATRADFDPKTSVAEVLVDAVDVEVDLNADLDRWIDLTMELEEAVAAPLELVTRGEYEADPPPRDPDGAPDRLVIWSWR